MLVIEGYIINSFKITNVIQTCDTINKIKWFQLFRERKSISMSNYTMIIIIINLSSIK